tara:strand:- start:17118 stop:18197 length:1080 start_codon:yes stop_codon:yes gene_type:complete
MSKKIHIPVNTMGSIVTKLGITSTDIVGMFDANDGRSMSTVLCSEDGSKYNELSELITGDTELLVHTYKDKKAYVIPGSSISMDKLKLNCKEHSIKITSDIDSADFFISNAHCCETQDSNVSKQALMFYINNGYASLDFNNTNIHNGNELMIDNSVEHVLWDSTVAYNRGFGMHSVDTDSLPYDTYVYTGLALQILDKINDGYSVIQGSRLLDESSNQVTLTKDLLDTILSMNKSYDDRLLLSKLLPTVRTDVNLHYVWELGQNLSSYDLNVNRDKDMKYWWYNKFENNKFNSMSPEEFILEYHESEVLTKEAFKYMEPKVRTDIQIYNRELYSFKVQIKPEYSKYYESNKRKESILNT